MNIKLSRREKQVLLGICHGLSAKEIASELGIAARSAETFRERLHKKTGVRGAALLVVWAIQNGHFSVNPPRRCQTCGQIIPL